MEVEITTKSSPFFFPFLSFYIPDYLLMTPALIMLVMTPSCNRVEVYYLKGVIQYSSGKRTKKLFIPNIGVSRTCQKHSESNRVNVIFGGHHSQVRRMYALCEVMRSYSEWKYYTPEAIFLAKRCEIPRSNLTKYLSDFYIFIYLFI